MKPSAPTPATLDLPKQTVKRRLRVSVRAGSSTSPSYRPSYSSYRRS